MKKRYGLTVFAVLLAAVALSATCATSLLNPSEVAINGQSRSANYDMLVNSMFNSNNVVSVVNGNMWIPWFQTSSNAQMSNLQSGSNCNSGQTIDLTHNCMVSDEFSQVGVLVSMGSDQSRMNAFYNTVLTIKSSNGNLPSWRVYRDGNSLEACRANINSNCDTASDADSRIALALFTASTNSLFTDSTQKARYRSLAVAMANDILTYETDRSCHPTRFGTVCNWLASGSEIKRSGLSTSDYAYTGYYPDAIIAMLAAYHATGDNKYLTAAKDFTANYLQAAQFDGTNFRVPPGKSFRWYIDASGQPQASCTTDCSPTMWDGFDAPRALGMCQAQYYASTMQVQLPSLAQYCNALSSQYMNDPSNAPIQFHSDGSPGPYQNGYFVQGLEALHQSGVSPTMFKASVDSALTHFSPSTSTFDYSPSFGVYTQVFVVRALGMGIGRDAAAFSSATIPPPPISPPPSPPPAISGGIATLKTSCAAAAAPCYVVSDYTTGSCRTILWSSSPGNIQVKGCEKSSSLDEVYALLAPANIAYKACIGAGCVSEKSGFASFNPGITSRTGPPAARTLTSVSTSCSAQGKLCTKVSDVTSGSCRTTHWTISSGPIQGAAVEIKGCDKGNGYIEVYRQTWISISGLKACMDVACIDSLTGFASFKL